jgi:hypothetical protein
MMHLKIEGENSPHGSEGIVQMNKQVGRAAIVVCEKTYFNRKLRAIESV